PRIINALGPGKRVYVFVIKLEVAGKGSELASFGNSGVRVLGTDLREFERRLQHALDAGGRKVAGMGAGGALSEENADANSARARLFQRFNLAQAYHSRKFVAFARDAFGRRCAA